jgi:hypothetical protein
MECTVLFALLFLWVAAVLALRHRRYALLQSICDSALSESDVIRRQTLVWFAHYLLTSLELNFEVKTAMSFRGLLATCAFGEFCRYSSFHTLLDTRFLPFLASWSQQAVFSAT